MNPRAAWFDQSKRATCSALLLACLTTTSWSVTAAELPSAEEIRQLVKDNMPAAMQQYREFLRLPNDGQYPEQTRANVDWVMEALDALSLDTQIIVSQGVPHVFAASETLEGAPTILFYLQIDGQPVDPQAWDQDDPFEPVIKRARADGWETLPASQWQKPINPEHRVFARSASDSKGPAVSLLQALRVLRDQQFPLPYNIKLIADFQEEMGSPSLPALVTDNRELLAADVMLIMDGTRHLSNLPTLTFGARGMATVTLTVYGAARDLHSGQYGNFAPNPVFTLSHLLASIKDEDGRVAIPGYYEGVELSALERQSLANIPEDSQQIMADLGIASADAVGSSYQEALQYPSLNVRGLRAAWVGEEVRTLIPRQARAELDLRLVPETPAERQLALLRQHIRDQGFYIVDNEPTAEDRRRYKKLLRLEQTIGSKPFRTDMNGYLATWLESAHRKMFGERFVKMRTTGGSQPIAPFIHTLGVPAVSVRIPNPDNSIHAPNENLRLGNFVEGMETCLAILTQPLKLPHAQALLNTTEPATATATATTNRN
ncbi:MAG: dipeptidase [Congregibacter sp.]